MTSLHTVFQYTQGKKFHCAQLFIQKWTDIELVPASFSSTIFGISPGMPLRKIIFMNWREIIYCAQRKLSFGPYHISQKSKLFKWFCNSVSSAKFNAIAKILKLVRSIDVFFRFCFIAQQNKSNIFDGDGYVDGNGCRFTERAYMVGFTWF